MSWHPRGQSSASQKCCALSAHLPLCYKAPLQAAACYWWPERGRAAECVAGCCGWGAAPLVGGGWVAEAAKKPTGLLPPPPLPLLPSGSASSSKASVTPPGHLAHQAHASAAVPGQQPCRRLCQHLRVHPATLATLDASQDGPARGDTLPWPCCCWQRPACAHVMQPDPLPAAHKPGLPARSEVHLPGAKSVHMRRGHCPCFRPEAVWAAATSAAIRVFAPHHWAGAHLLGTQSCACGWPFPAAAAAAAGELRMSAAAVAMATAACCASAACCFCSCSRLRLSARSCACAAVRH